MPLAPHESVNLFTGLLCGDLGVEDPYQSQVVLCKPVIPATQEVKAEG
jgi:hypothetical protein